ncbi:MAG: hypothetical protein ACOYLB_03710 [Phototrophicaceae bacterium]
MSVSFYRFKLISEQVLFIKWYQSPPLQSPILKQYYRDIEAELNNALLPVYIVSDLERGRIHDVKFLRDLASMLLAHPRYGGSTAFASDEVSKIFVGVFRQAMQQPRDTEIFNTPQAAFEYLEKLSPNLLKGIEWEKEIREE